MATILVKRGLQSGIDAVALQIGEFGLATDTGNLYIGTTTGKKHINNTGEIVDVFEASNQSAMLGLSNAGQGDICVRSDESKSYILKQKPASTLANWVLLKTPDGAVISVAGRTGAVTLTKSDVGLGKAENTPDFEKTVAAAAKLTTIRTLQLKGGATTNPYPFNGTEDAIMNVTSLNAAMLTGTVDGGTF